MLFMINTYLSLLHLYNGLHVINYEFEKITFEIKHFLGNSHYHGFRHLFELVTWDFFLPKHLIASR